MKVKKIMKTKMCGNKKISVGILRLVLVALFVSICFAGGFSTYAAESSGPEFKDYSDLAGKRVSMLTGAPFEDLVRSKVPDVGEFSYYNSMADMILALRNDKTDAILMNNAVVTLALNRNEDMALFPEDLQDGVFGFAFVKGGTERDRWQEAYESISDETKNELWEKWTGSDESAKTIPKQDWPGKNGTIRAAVCDSLEPMSYVGQDGELKGFDIEMILTMAKKLDMHVDLTGMEFSAVMASVESEKADIGAGSIIVNDERRKAADFVEYYPAAFELIVRAEQTDSEYTSLDDFRNKRIATLTGAIQGPLVEEKIPSATVSYYNNHADMLEAVRQGQEDAMAAPDIIIRYMMIENEDLTYLKEDPLAEPFEIGAIFPKTGEGDALREEFNEFIKKLKSDGTMEELDEIWFGSDESRKNVKQPSELHAKRGTLRMATDRSNPPVMYVSNNHTTGMDYDIAIRFCEAYGYGLEVIDMNFSGVVDAIASNKCDFAIGGIAITPERKESVNFSEPYNACGSVIGYLKPESDNGSGSFFASIKESFYKTFIKENRWKMFLSGVGTTLLITILSILFGTLLGFIVFMLCRKDDPIALRITRFFVWLIQGMPVVVLLMILYYIIFARTGISGTFVSVIGFTLIFAASVYGMLKAGVGAVDGGQLEAAYSLGYTDRRAFFHIILPQAMPHFMPAYKGQITALIKATAVVGYIAVQDLTKAGDLIRSRTYEAFFPLIAVAVIYFILAAILTYLVNKVELRTDPRRRKPEKILEGTETK